MKRTATVLILVTGLIAALPVVAGAGNSSSSGGSNTAHNSTRGGFAVAGSGMLAMMGLGFIGMGLTRRRR